MTAKVFSATTIGLNSHLIEVEADILSSNPNFFIVGLPDAAVQEAKERVRSAIKNSDLLFPRTRVVVNLAPADLKKAGPSFDLPMAIAILTAKKTLVLNSADKQALFVGELSLDGSLKPVNGVLAIAAQMQDWQKKTIYLPKENAAEASLAGNLNIFPIENLSQLINHLKGEIKIKPFKKIIKPRKVNSISDLNLNAIKGQEHAKRALMIAAAGYHNLLMFGPPGSGKTLLAQALRELLPPLSLSESLEVTKIYSVAGLLKTKEPLITARPFRSPHHTSSGIALVGGGSFPKPGEITLAHRGILFLDELPEFSRQVLETLRQPLEDGVITIARAASAVQFPARFTLVATANPCACGFLNDSQKPCRCTITQIKRYQKRISGPLLDRIDLQVSVPRLKTDELIDKKENNSCQNWQEKIINAHKIQQQRLKQFNLLYNSEMNHKLVEKFCFLNDEGEKLLKQAIVSFQLSARSYHKILKISRTIADLENEEKIKTEHLAEALQYRQNMFE